MVRVRRNRENARTRPSPRGHDRQVRVRRRGADLEGAILEAAWEELVAVGYAHLTIDGVVARARTSKPVLYRRWPSRPALVLAAMRHRAPLLSGPVPDTGSLRGDVLTLLNRISERLAAVGPEVVYGLLADCFRDNELFTYLQAEVLEVGSSVMMTILEHAAERGEVHWETVTLRLATLPVDLLRHEILVTRAPATPSALLEIVDDIFLPLIQAPKQGPAEARV